MENDLRGLDFCGSEGEAVTLRKGRWVGKRAGRDVVSALPTSSFFQASPESMCRTGAGLEPGPWQDKTNPRPQWSWYLNTAWNGLYGLRFEKQDHKTSKGPFVGCNHDIIFIFPVNNFILASAHCLVTILVNYSPCAWQPFRGWWRQNGWFVGATLQWLYPHPCVSLLHLWRRMGAFPPGSLILWHLG